LEIDMDGREPTSGALEALRYHGGNIAAARSLYPDAPEPWIDLSTGISPISYPIGTVAASAWTRLPEPSDATALECTARRAYGGTDETPLVAGAGTQALLQWLPRIVPARRVAILGPTYTGHQTAWRDAGADVEIVGSLDQLRSHDVAVVVNPDNPTGRLIVREPLLSLAADLHRRAGLLVVDEAFMDVIGPAASVIPVLPPRGLVVLRSFGKAYGLAGVRLGFLAGPADLVERMRQVMGVWNLSGPAIAIGRRALSDTDWLAGTVRRLNDGVSRLDALLQDAGCVVEGGTPLFRYARSEAAPQIFDRLCRAGILTRPFADRPDHLRLGIPADDAAWVRLAAALKPV
jgi:cobalamin biosynthesis protein CobC